MNRRSFISLLACAAAHQAMKPIYVFAPPSGWKMGGSGLFTPGEAMFLLPGKGMRVAFGTNNGAPVEGLAVRYLKFSMNIIRDMTEGK